MKNLFVLLAAILLIVSCQKSGNKTDAPSELPSTEESVQKPADGKYPKMEFSETEFDFGDIKQGEKVTHEFTFTNNGDADLVISKAYGSCGCTVPDYPKESIEPGKSGNIKVTFDSAGKMGRQQKSVTLLTNTPNGKEQLQIKVNINPGT